MTMQDLSLFQALGAKMDYLNQRQGIIAQNVANSDTPGYRPKDLEEYDFSSLLKGKLGGQAVRVDTTDDLHMPHADKKFDPDSKKQKDTYEVAPAGNAVIIEEQMINSGRNAMDYNLMLNVYKKQVGMFKIALGAGR